MITSCLLDLVFYVLGEWDNEGNVNGRPSSSFNVSAVVSMFVRLRVLIGDGDLPHLVAGGQTLVNQTQLHQRK